MNAVSKSSGILEAMNSQVQRAETWRWWCEAKRQKDRNTKKRSKKDKNTKSQKNRKTKAGRDLVSGEVAGVADGLLHPSADQGVHELGELQTDLAIYLELRPDQGVHELGEGSREADDWEGGQAGTPGC